MRISDWSSDVCSSDLPLKHTLSGRDEKTMMKLIVAQDSQRVVGIHMVGLDAPEIIQGMAVALKAGATKQVFDATVVIHPTAAEEFVTMHEPLPGDQAQAAEHGHHPDRKSLGEGK